MISHKFFLFAIIYLITIPALLFGSGFAIYEHGIIANEFLGVMDTQLGATITKVDISALPGVEVTSVSKLALNPYTKTPIFSKDAFDHLNILFGGRK